MSVRPYHAPPRALAIKALPTLVQCRELEMYSQSSKEVYVHRMVRPCKPKAVHPMCP